MMLLTLLVLAQAGVAAHPCPAGTGQPIDFRQNGLSPLKVVRKVVPQITGQARRAGMPASILTLRIVVPEKGPPCNIRVINSIGFGLDEAAIAAVRQWEFQQMSLGGKAVAVDTTVEVSFFIESTWMDPDEIKRNEFNVALDTIISGDPTVERDAAATMERLSSKKYGPAEAYFGFMLYSGEMVPKDYPRAVELIKRANKKNMPFGIFAMGILLAEGKAVPADQQEALRLIREASFAQVPAAQLWLGRYAMKQGDIDTAKKYFRLCCKDELEKLK